MAIVALTKANFDRTVRGTGIVLIDCWAGWCAACETFAPVYETVAARHPAHTFGKLDAQAERPLVASLGVKHIPSLLLYRDGIMLFNQPGNFDEQALEEIVSKAESIDMDKVRAHMAAERH